MPTMKLKTEKNNYLIPSQHDEVVSEELQSSTHSISEDCISESSDTDEDMLPSYKTKPFSFASLAESSTDSEEEQDETEMSSNAQSKPQLSGGTNTTSILSSRKSGKHTENDPGWYRPWSTKRCNTTSSLPSSLKPEHLLQSFQRAGIFPQSVDSTEPRSSFLVKKHHAHLLDKSITHSSSSSSSSSHHYYYNSAFDYYLVLDFECTCSKTTISQEIIEFPVVLLCARTLSVVDVFHSFVRPVEHPILTDFCTELTGISQDDVDQAPYLQEVLMRFAAWLRDRGIVIPSDFSKCLGDYNFNIHSTHLTQPGDISSSNETCEQLHVPMNCNESLSNPYYSTDIVTTSLSYLYHKGSPASRSLCVRASKPEQFKKTTAIRAYHTKAIESFVRPLLNASEALVTKLSTGLLVTDTFCDFARYLVPECYRKNILLFDILPILTPSSYSSGFGFEQNMVKKPLYLCPSLDSSQSSQSFSKQIRSASNTEQNGFYFVDHLDRKYKVTIDKDQSKEVRTVNISSSAGAGAGAKIVKSIVPLKTKEESLDDLLSQSISSLSISQRRKLKKMTMAKSSQTRSTAKPPPTTQENTLDPQNLLKNSSHLENANENKIEDESTKTLPKSILMFDYLDIRYRMTSEIAQNSDYYGFQRRSRSIPFAMPIAKALRFYKHGFIGNQHSGLADALNISRLLVLISKLEFASILPNTSIPLLSDGFQ